MAVSPSLTVLNQSFSFDKVKRVSPSALAYLGDAVFELMVRTYFIYPQHRINDYHQRVVSCVKAEAQANYARILSEHLNDIEAEVFRRGRNSAFGKPKRVSLVTYQQATGFESLLGYLYLTDIARLEELLELLPDFRQKSGD